MQPVADFYEVPARAIRDLRGTRGPRWLRKRLEPFARPADRWMDPEYFVPCVLGFLESKGLLDQEPQEYEDVHTDLVEFLGGGWAVLEASPELVEALDPRRYRRSALREYYLGRGWKSEQQDPGLHMCEALVALRDAIAATADGHLLLVHMTARPR